MVEMYLKEFILLIIIPFILYCLWGLWTGIFFIIGVIAYMVHEEFKRNRNGKCDVS